MDDIRRDQPRVVRGQERDDSSRGGLPRVGVVEGDVYRPEIGLGKIGIGAT